MRQRIREFGCGFGEWLLETVGAATVATLACCAWVPGLTSGQPLAVLAESPHAFEGPCVRMDNLLARLGLDSSSLSG